MKTLLIIFLAGVTLSSCAPTKSAAYFRRNIPNTGLNVPDHIYQIDNAKFEKIKIGDELYITVTSGNDDPNSFNQQRGVATLGIELISYKVDNEGNIRLPYLNTIKVEGKTVNELIENLEEMLEQYIYLPSVSIRVVNSRVIVLGEVGAPGVYTFNQKPVTIFEVFAHAGDIGPFGDKKNVLIMRKEGDEIKKKYIDLTNDEIINSVWYEIQTDDLIYVEPLRRSTFGMETFSVFDLFSLISGTFAMYVLFTTIGTSE